MDEATGLKGDNDPIDVLEIGYRVKSFWFFSTLIFFLMFKSLKINLLYFKVAKRGEVLKVKVLGIVALIDEGKI